ncbi:MAG: hypothetical protein KAG53_09840 [Endozoicomonadaceae bacterium]|nr:hypothetical protein [Endozoicomonadaceae bacterium]
MEKVSGESGEMDVRFYALFYPFWFFIPQIMGNIPSEGISRFNPNSSEQHHLVKSYIRWIK